MVRERVVAKGVGNAVDYRRASQSGRLRAERTSRNPPSGLARHLLRFRTRHSDNHDLFRFARALMLLLAGLVMVSVSGLVDPLLHRGVETGSEVPYVRQTTGRELATNVDLTRFELDQIEPILTSLQTNGFVYLRQPVSWAQAEPTEGQFDWTKFDAIVNGATARGMRVIALINDTPEWARRASELNYPDAPPANLERLSTFLTALATRYGESLSFYQIYDRPNLPVNWGGSAPSPSEYTELLSIAYNVLRSINTESRVILAELDPYGADTQPGNDLAYLNQLYDVGAAPYFDIAAFRLDGGSRSPSDRTVSETRINMSRAIAMRELMIEQGDGAKSIWATRYGWNANEDQGHDLVAGYLWEGIVRARNEWPWMGPLFAWDLAPTSDETSGYALLNTDGTVRPQFESLADFGTSERSRIAPTGFAPMLSSSMSYQGTWQAQHLDPNVYRTTSEVGATITFHFEGTGIEAILRQSPDAGLIRATLDGEPLPTDRFPVEDGASVIDLEWFTASDIRSTLASGLGDGTHVLEV